MANPLHIITRFYYRLKYRNVKRYMQTDEFKRKVKGQL